MLSIDDLDNLIQSSKTQSIEDLQKNVSRLMSSIHNYKRNTWHKFELQGLYRARQHNHLEGNSDIDGNKFFDLETEFWNTPQKYCKLGRCNADNESIFYCTNEFEVAIQEIRPTLEYISVSHFRPKPTFLQKTCKTAIPIGVRYLSELNGLKKQSFKIDENFVEIDDFLDKIFHLNVLPGNEHMYKLSTAITRNFMSPIRTRWFDVPMQGIVYPSMARDKKGFNIAFRPNHVVYNYYLCGVQTLKVIENTNDHITLQLIRNGIPLAVRNSPEIVHDMFWYEPLKNGEVHTFQKKLTK